MKKYILIFISLLLLFTSCTSQQNAKQLTIATNAWIGYAPLFYAKEKGYLKKLNIHLIPNVSLAEASDVYSVGRANMVTTTQHEYYSLKNMGHNITPIILLDRSNGGDMVLSNKSVTQLQNAKKIYAYLEIDSINAEILTDFIKHYKIDKNKITFINQDQAQIESLKPNKTKNILITTYVPYNLKLQSNGFREVASTKHMDTIMVIDALCANKNTITNNSSRLKALKVIIDKSIQEIQTDKRGSYELVKSYLNNMSYGEYVDSLQLIKWINKPSKKLLEHIEPMGYKEKDLL